MIRRVHGIDDELAGAHRTAVPLLNTSLPPRTLARVILNGRPHDAVHDKALVVFVRTRCVASYRALTFVSGQATVAEAQFPVLVVVADSDQDAQRMVSGIAASFLRISIRRGQLPRALRKSLPFAAVLGRERKVVHVGRIGEISVTAKFVEACGDAEIRQWLNALPADAEVRSGHG